MPEHDQMVEAFRRIAPDAGTHGRKNREKGYTHIHGPNFPFDPRKKRCRTHAALVERKPCKVFVRAPGGEQLEAPLIRDEHAGHFTHGWSFEQILARWPTLEDFAREVIETARKNGEW